MLPSFCFCSDTSSKIAARWHFFRPTVLALQLLLVPCIALPHHLNAQEEEYTEYNIEEMHRWEYDPDLQVRWRPPGPHLPRKMDVAPLLDEEPNVVVAAAQRILVQTRFGVINRNEAFQAALKALSGLSDNRQARLAVASAAARLADSREEIEQVWNLLGEQPIIQAALEPELVRWKSELALEQWRARIENPIAELPALLSAIDGIGAVGNATDQQRLMELLFRDGTPEPIQLTTSKAIGAIVAEGLEQTAERMIRTGKLTSLLFAAHLLSSHESKQALKLYEQVLQSEHTGVHTIAFQNLIRINRDHARTLAGELLEHSENKVRGLAVQVSDSYDDEESFNLQAEAFDDPNLNIRMMVRKNFEAKAANPELRHLVSDVITYHLSGDSWEGTEQALYLAAALFEHQRAPKIFELLDHPMAEINMRAAWALQRLDLKPGMLDQIQKTCQVTTDRLSRGEDVSLVEELRVAFLLEAIGRHEYEPADTMLRVYIPKNDQKMHIMTRTSAIYAIGRIWANSQDRKLARQLAQRMLDDNPTDPEADTVKYVCAIALGRILHPSSVAELKKVIDTTEFPLGAATDWSLRKFGEQANGEN